MTMRETFNILLIFILLGSCNLIPDIKSLYVINSTNNDIEIIYDDRFYRSQLDTTMTLDTISLKPDSTFFIGVDTSISNIWPMFLVINNKTDSIILKGRHAIKTIINDQDNNNFYIRIK